jgi:hypothetical protein
MSTITPRIVQNMLQRIISENPSMPELQQTATLALKIWSIVEVSIILASLARALR